MPTACATTVVYEATGKKKAQARFDISPAAKLDDPIGRADHPHIHVVALRGVRRVGNHDPLRLRNPLVLPRVDALQVELVAVPAHADRTPPWSNRSRFGHASTVYGQCTRSRGRCAASQTGDLGELSASCSQSQRTSVVAMTSSLRPSCVSTHFNLAVTRSPSTSVASAPIHNSVGKLVSERMSGGVKIWGLVDYAMIAPCGIDHPDFDPSRKAVVHPHRIACARTIASATSGVYDFASPPFRTSAHTAIRPAAADRLTGRTKLCWIAGPQRSGPARR